MTKEEIALELTKTISERIIRDERHSLKEDGCTAAIVDAYNYIYKNLILTDK